MYHYIFFDHGYIPPESWPSLWEMFWWLGAPDNTSATLGACIFSCSVVPCVAWDVRAVGIGWCNECCGWSRAALIFNWSETGKTQVKIKMNPIKIQKHTHQHCSKFLKFPKEMNLTREKSNLYANGFFKVRHWPRTSDITGGSHYNKFGGQAAILWYN